MRISDWSSDVCSSDLRPQAAWRVAGKIEIRAVGTGQEIVVHRDHRGDAAICDGCENARTEGLGPLMEMHHRLPAIDRRQNGGKHSDSIPVPDVRYSGLQEIGRAHV